MAEFLEVALSYPTLPYSVVFAFAVIYWLLAATGIYTTTATNISASISP